MHLLLLIPALILAVAIGYFFGSRSGKPSGCFLPGNGSPSDYEISDEYIQYRERINIHF